MQVSLHMDWAASIQPGSTKRHLFKSPDIPDLYEISLQSMIMAVFLAKHKVASDVTKLAETTTLGQRLIL
jgi:hypothetical protein